MSANLLLTVNYIGNKTSHVWLGITQDPSEYLAQYGTTGSCTIPYNVPGVGLENLNYKVCNEPSGTTETDTNGYHVTNVNARKMLNLINPTWGAKMQGGVLTDFSFGDGSYNGLLVSVEKRMSRGFSVLGNYTWSHCMDNGEVGEDVSNVAMNPANPKNSSWGNCSYNNKEIANLSVVAQSPRMGNRAENMVLSGWNGSGIFTAQTGTYFSVTDNYDISLTGVGLDRPNIVGDPYKGGTVAANPTCNAPAQVRTAAYWYNPCAFAYAPLGTFGNEVRNSIVGPANWNLNLALWRSFSLPEKVKLDFRVEAFNALNHTQLGQPTATLATSGTNLNVNSNAGLITTSNSFYQPRILQLAIKANF